MELINKKSKKSGLEELFDEINAESEDADVSEKEDEE